MSVSKPRSQSTVRLAWFRDGPAGLLNQPGLGWGVPVVFGWLRSERSERLETPAIVRGWACVVSRRPCGPPQPAGVGLGSSCFVRLVEERAE